MGFCLVSHFSFSLATSWNILLQISTLSKQNKMFLFLNCYSVTHWKGLLFLSCLEVLSVNQTFHVYWKRSFKNKFSFHPTNESPVIKCVTIFNTNVTLRLSMRCRVSRCWVEENFLPTPDFALAYLGGCYGGGSLPALVDWFKPVL